MNDSDIINRIVDLSTTDIYHRTQLENILKYCVSIDSNVLLDLKFILENKKENHLLTKKSIINFLFNKYYEIMKELNLDLLIELRQEKKTFLDLKQKKNMIGLKNNCVICKKNYTIWDNGFVHICKFCMEKYNLKNVRGKMSKEQYNYNKYFYIEKHKKN